MKRLLVILGAISISIYPIEPWTWQFQYLLTPRRQHELRQKKEVIFSTTNIPHFTQLLCNWNALRPSGHFSFFVQLHSAKKKRWGLWHKIADWGASVQKSYETVSDGIAKHIYVRSEIESGDKADGFRVKVVGAGADLGLLKALTVNTSDHTKFAHEKFRKGTFASLLLEGVPQKSQLELNHEDKRKMCSPTSCSMVCEYITGRYLDPLSFATGCYDKGLRVYGSWPFNMAHAFEVADGSHLFYATRLQGFCALYKQLERKLPVVVSVRGAIIGAPKAYDNGHLLVVIGYDAHKHCIICHDPAACTDGETLKEYSVDSFIKAWDRSRRLSYIAKPVVS